jgi:hypothetical protein
VCNVARGNEIDTMENGIIFCGSVGMSVASQMDDNVHSAQNGLPINLAGEIRHDRDIDGTGK